MKILLLEDEVMLCKTIEEYLSGLGHRVESFHEGDKAMENVDAFDLLILDINVPNMSGLEVIKALNEKGCSVPVIFISALIDIEKISQAFELGASDYLKKPFHLKELGLRVDRIKREQGARNPQHIILSQHYHYIRDEEQLFYYKSPVDLTKRQLQILRLLCENIDSIVNFERFRSYVWSDEPVDNATIRAEISRFRKTLKEDFIVNIKGVGYRINRYYRKEK
ncbi:MAG: response regulator transcription factor [Campylobacteraceae bacterium]|nr:response regulator transcription factor [Campylobacteraceae bacterium]